MIAFFKGKIIEAQLEKDVLKVEIDVQGVGYEVLMPKSSEGLINPGQSTTLYVSESVTAFDGATTYYGFSSREEKTFFVRIRENVDGMGPKKALECMDKISKSMPDFKRAVIDGDVALLVSVFGFTKKTADKLVFSLKGKVEGWTVTGPVKWAQVAKSSEESEAMMGLVNLGYRDDEAREAVQKAKTNLGPKSKTEKILTEALRLIGNRI